MNIPLLLTVVFALAAALLAYVVIDAGSAAMAQHRAQFTQRARVQLRDLFLFFDPAKLYLANLAAMAMGAILVYAITDSVVLMLGSGAVLFFMPPWAWRFLRHRRLLKVEQQLPDALLMISGGLRAGVSLSVALQNYVDIAQPPLAQELELMLREQRLGVSLDDSLGHLARRVPTQTMSLVVSAVRIANETGGGLAETLERTSHTLRSKFQVEGKIRALTSQGKLQAVIVGLLPVLLIYILSGMEPEAMSKLWTTYVGWATLAVIVFLELTGIYLIRRIVSIDV
ncbi:type II secretion system F family protein [Aquabacterium sp. A7-Y]|uniref:type II secretion system F family protein n=1 Tax=Aquabacterium sp. A7-Y TaxID=1349605 RepID=UPI00223DA4B2|nr:type II secretion system F family protein [Aquabacterium sp. A7-Y]MCW7540693.1 type II secretion system F family protein [Aquabacterium sp. A7-Y]